MKSLALLSFIHIAIAIQPSAKPAKPTELRQLEWGKLNFLQTSDTHGWLAGHLTEPQYSADWGDYLTFTQHMRSLADEQGVDLLVFDTGDRIEGSGLSDASDPPGKYVREIFKTVEMDVVTIGNHELYKEASAANEYLHMRTRYGDKWVVSNVDIYAPDTGNRVPLGNRFRKFKTKNQGIRVTAFAFLFDFKGNYKNTVVTEVEEAIKEKWFLDAIKDTDVDLFVIIGHTPVRDSPEFPAILDAIRSIHPTIPVQFFGGHTHIRDFIVYDESSTGIEPGRFCESVGFLSISHIPSTSQPEPIVYSRRYLDFNRVSFMNHTLRYEENFDSPKGLEVSKEITKIRTGLGLDKLYGCAPQDYYTFRVPYPHPDSLYSLFENEILPKQARSPKREGVPTLVYVNTGGIRFDIFKGPFTWDVSFTVSPFSSAFRYLKDVPYSAAKQLIKLFNDDPRTWIREGVEGLDTSVPLGPLEPHYHFSKLWKQAAKHHLQMKFNPSSETPGMQAVLGQLNILNHPRLLLAVGEDDELLAADHQKHKYTPGYRTIDDFGADGDDTKHTPIPFYSVKNCIVANHTFEEYFAKGSEPEKVDVVFLDFIEPYMLAGLELVGVTYGKEDVEEYLPTDVHVRSMMLDFAKEEWKCERE